MKNFIWISDLFVVFVHIFYILDLLNKQENILRVILILFFTIYWINQTKQEYKNSRK